MSSKVIVKGTPVLLERPLAQRSKFFCFFNVFLSTTRLSYISQLKDIGNQNAL